MVIKLNKYEITDVFVGIVAFGKAIIGVDIDDDAVGLVAGKKYIGWKFN